VTWVATAGTMGVLFAAAAVVLAFDEPILRVFIDDPEVVAEGVVFLWYLAPFWAFFGGTMVVQGGFRGADQTKVAMVLSFLSRWVFRVPVAVTLAFSTVALPAVGPVEVGLGIGVEGVWAAFSVGAFLSFLVAVFWFNLGRWTEGVVDGSDPGGPPVGAEADAEPDVGPDTSD